MSAVPAPDARHSDLVINCTSVGLHAGDAPPLDLSTLTRETDVIDIIAVRETELMQAAKAKGCRVVGGRPMIELPAGPTIDVHRHAAVAKALGADVMKTLNGPGVFLAQFITAEPPFDRLDTLAKWAAEKGFCAVQLPTFNARIFTSRRRPIAMPTVTR